MVAAGERFAEEDKARREVIETANRGESFVNDTTKSLQEFEAQLDNAEKEKVKGLLEELRELAAKGAAGDASVTSEQIKGAMDAAQTASLGLFQKVSPLVRARLIIRCTRSAMPSHETNPQRMPRSPRRRRRRIRQHIENEAPLSSLAVLSNSGARLAFLGI